MFYLLTACMLNDGRTCQPLAYCSSVVGQSKTSGQFPKLGDLLNTFKVIKLVACYSFGGPLLL